MVNDKEDYFLLFMGLAVVGVMIYIAYESPLVEQLRQPPVTLPGEISPNVALYYNLDDPTITYIKEGDDFKEVAIVNA